MKAEPGRNATLYGLPEAEKPVIDQILELMQQQFNKYHNKSVQAVRLGHKTEKHKPIEL